MEDLLLHPKTRQQIKQLIPNQPHGILIAGQTGSGKETTAKILAASLLEIERDKLDGYAYYQEVNPEGDSISIEEIRTLQQFLKLKVPASTSKPIQRLIFIQNAARMRTEAQNALLKTLEEPPTDTAIILTVDSADQLLATITSRTTLLPILPVSLAQADEYFGTRGKKTSDIAKFYALSQGQAGLLHALLHEESHPLLAQVELAKIILAEKPGERLYRVDELSKDKTNLKLLLNALSRISHAALQAASSKNNEPATRKWHQTQKEVLETLTKLKYNPNTKLLLDNLFLSI